NLSLDCFGFPPGNLAMTKGMGKIRDCFGVPYGTPRNDGKSRFPSGKPRNDEGYGQNTRLLRGSLRNPSHCEPQSISL
ncbi:MAG: hypothetical protein ACPLPS_06400, partial [bacterium]